ncbi:MAG: hypothetical protein CMF72_24745 [Mameliella sp.]|mgnify:CR=1 FL=1|nr:hypothetical protein [Mameliella sp.]
MPEWLDGTVVAEVIGADLAAGTDTTVLNVHADAVREYVEDRRPDLFVPALVDGDPAVFTPPGSVVLAAGMLAYRTYQNRTKPESEIADLPDLAAMLKIGKRRGLRFGGAQPYDEAAS